jgi:hypothetical protein
MDEFKFEVTKEIGILSEGPKGWHKEVNLVSWNERKPKLDIRDWEPGHAKMGKGITLTPDEARKLKEFLNSIDIDELD